MGSIIAVSAEQPHSARAYGGMIMNELDRKLFERVNGYFVNTDKMRELIAAGADVNAKDATYKKTMESIR